MRDFKVGDEVATASGIVSTVTEVLGDTVHVIYQDGSATSWRKEVLTLVSKGREAVDMVNNPPHYTAHPSGVECIEITRHMGFNVGNAVKYLWRADLKGAAIQDLEKAAFYIQDEITKRKAANG